MAKRGNRDEYWATLISEWRVSGLSQLEFCRRRGISDRALNNWLYKSPYRERMTQVLAARTRDNPQEEPPKFVPVTLVPASRVIEPRGIPASIEVVLKSGTRIVVSPGFDDEMLRRVLTVLAVRPC
jgi:hypothetical protein